MGRTVTPLDTTIVDRVCQGDIISNVDFIISSIIDGKQTVSELRFAYVIVLSQDCDLQQDYTNRIKNNQLAGNQTPEENINPNHDKILVSAIVAPLYNYEQFRRGEHLSEFGYIMQHINSNIKGHVENNSHPRYHTLDFGDNNTYGMVKSVIDFKHYFSVSINYLESIKQSNFVGKIKELYREDISHRFAAFLSRVGLPNP